MKKVQLNGESYLLVEVPEYLRDIQHHKSYEDSNEYITYYHNFGTVKHYLPPGDYTPIGLASELDWKECVGIVESENDGSGINGWWFKNYMVPETMLKNPIKSFLSFLASQDCKPDTTYILKLNSK